ncbi:MAG: HTH domain-containing protein [Bacteroidales bacterium]|nr:HTH domain-containing protein [Bacteroidales bacterium]
MIRLDQLIRLKNTGSANDMAKKLEVSESTVYRLIDVLRIFVRHDGGNILYDKEKKTYYYDPSGYFLIKFIAYK